MKSLLEKFRLTGARWNVLTVLLVSLTVVVCLVYAVIFLDPQVLPAQLQVRAKTPTQASSAARATRPFPTFPAAWTAAYTTRQTQAATPTPLRPSSQSATPALSLTATVATNSPALATPTLPTGTGVTVAPLTPASPSPTAPEATVTTTEVAATPLPSPATPLPTSSPEGYPTGYPGEVATWTPLPPGYPTSP
jgi:hypothetical protein